MVNVKCKKCNKVTDSQMRYCLLQNKCAFCGTPLFSDSDMNQINFLQNKIASQKFGKSLDEFTIYDITIFMLSEMRKMKKTIVEQERARYHNTEDNEGAEDDSKGVVLEAESVTWEEGGEPVIEVPEHIPAPLDESEKQRLRDEIAAKYAGIDPEIDDSAFVGEGDDKISRLKRIASQHRGIKTGPVVSRVDG